MNRKPELSEPTAFLPRSQANRANARNRALEIIGGVSPLEDALDSLVHFVEAQCHGSLLAAVTLVDYPQSRLRVGSGPSLPQWFLKAIAETDIASGLATCAAAAARNEAVETPDIATAESWAGLAHLPLSLGLRAAWSMPIRGNDGRVLATFDSYFPAPRRPTAIERDVVAALCGPAAATIERRVVESEFRDAERRTIEFLAVLSHELRGPLAPLTAGIELLSGSSNRSAGLEELCAMMKRQVDQLVRLAEDLKDVSSISHGEIPLELASVDVADAVNASAEQVGDRIRRCGHELVVGHTGRCIVRGDLGRLTQVFTNLLTNAAKYTPEGGIVRIETEATADHVRTRVTDTGLGFPPESAAALFKMFSRLPEHRHSDEGLGIGLALSARLVDLHGGTIGAYSAGPGCGSQFTVLLPRVATDSKTGTRRKHPLEASGSRSGRVSDETRLLDAAHTTPRDHPNIRS